ncbi:flagellin [Marinobacter nauticus]|uniref:Flagellin n=1 Tax=Marinobacter nauticus TaxID=2743 RepID=A0A1M2UX74_MARNT|nr:flagellin [Marinobacter nauticus]OJS99897.1 flagellin [Marinobacter nauticus]
MPQVINTNIASLNAQRNLNASQGDANVALQRLSSGLRINSAKDDAAGLAISERFQSQIAGLNQAQRNANDGISLAQTAEGAMDEITNNLQRIRELAVQSANATNSISDRQALNQEVQQRIQEINRIASQTSFNGLKVLDGTFGTQTFQVGANAGETIGISGLDSRGSQIGSVLKQTSNLSGFAGGETRLDISSLDFENGNINVSGTIGGEPITVGAASYDDAEGLAEAINDQIGGISALDGLTASASEDGASIVFTNTTDSEFTTNLTVTDDTGNQTVVDGTDISLTVSGGATPSDVLFDVNSLDSSLGEVTGSFTVDDGTTSTEVTFSAPQNASEGDIRQAIEDALTTAGLTDLSPTLSGTEISIDNSSASATYDITGGVIQDGGTPNGSGTLTTPITPAEETSLAEKFANGETYSFQATINDEVYQFENIGSLNDLVSQVNAQSNETGIQANLNRSNDEIYFSSQFDEPFTVDIQADFDGDGNFDAATETVQNLQATAEDNTISMDNIDISTAKGADEAMIAIDYAIDSINGFRAELGAVQNRFESTIANLSTTSENLSASNSRIRDADFAAETAELARTQVLQSAGLSVLAQANARPQQVLQLLQG